MNKSRIYINVSLFASYLFYSKIHLCLDYAINNFPIETEVKEIAKQWNKKDSKFVLDLRVGIVYVSLLFIFVVYL
jgi:hypothetical protein